MELLDIIDTDGNVTNKTEDRKIVHQNGLLHHASGVIFVRQENNEYELLSQQRSLKKEKNAGLWDLSASGHVPSGQSPIKSLVREIKEELGLSVKENELSLLGKFWRNEIHKENFIENELMYVYICKKEIDISDITMQKDEVDDVKWISIKDFKMLLDNKQAVARKGVWDCLFEKLEKI